MFRYFIIYILTSIYSINWLSAQITLLDEIKISDIGLYFDGDKVGYNSPNPGPGQYDYFFGSRITPHGDCIKKYNEFVFMTWYKGGKYNRHVMLTRYNTITGTMATIEFPHTHTGFRNQWWIGESHNTIAIGISPKNGTIHLLYDMHSYSKTNPSDGSFKDDYFRYTFSKENAASVPDSDFKIDQFVKDTDGDYKHLSLTGTTNHSQFSRLTYPKFFVNTGGDLIMYMRVGGNNNGGYKFAKYDGISTWSSFTQFNALNAQSQGNSYDWGLYGNMKFINGKMRIGFQQRASIQNDKFLYQNGIYYAYSDHPDGFNNWKSYKGVGFTLPLVNSDKIKVFEPGDLVTTTQTDKVYIVGGFDWTVTNKGDVHIISKVKDNENNVTKHVHTYMPSDSTEFITSTNFSGAENIYTSGKNIYIIGLTSAGRPYVEKASGGTNNFTREYEATSGRTYRHGVVYIADGKLYYYLMEKGSGDKQPIYLQIIDLDLDVVPNQSPNVYFSNPNADTITVNVGYQLSVRADATDPDGNIDSVKLFINNNFLRTEIVATYDWGHNNSPDPNELNGLPIGIHQLTVTGYDNDGATNSDTLYVKVVAPNLSPDVYFSNPNTDTITVNVGYQLAVQADATDPDGNIDSVKLFINNNFLRTEIVATYDWGHNNSPDPNELNGLPIGIHQLTVIGYDNEGATDSDTLYIKVEDHITGIENTDSKTLVIFPNPSKSGIFSLSIKINYEISDIQGKTILSGFGKQVNLANFPNGTYFLKSSYGTTRLSK